MLLLIINQSLLIMRRAHVVVFQCSLNIFYCDQAIHPTDSGAFGRNRAGKLIKLKYLVENSRYILLSARYFLRLHARVVIFLHFNFFTL